MLSRRELIKLGLYGGTGGILHLVRQKSGAYAWALDEDKRRRHEHEHDHDDDEHDDDGRGGPPGGPPGGSPPPPPAFTSTLPIPPVKQQVLPSTLPGVEIYNDGVPTSYYELVEMPGPVPLFPGMQPTVIWGFDGGTTTPAGLPSAGIRTHLGPTFVANIGERVVIRIHNNLGAGIDSIVHHHGAHVGSDWDGSALWSQQIHFGTFKDFVYPNDDDIAATHWYHDHDIDFTGRNVYMGLEGMFLLHDAGELNLNLPGHPTNDPAQAGELPFDLPLVIQDRAFDAAGQLAYNPFNFGGVIGDTFLVNGAIQPTARVAPRKYRFRILNGSNARFYHLMLQTSTGVPIPFHIVGSDGGLYNTAVQVDGGFMIAPAERVEVIVDFSGLALGTKVFLNNCLMQTDGRKPAGLVANCAAVPQTPGPDGVGSLLSFNIAFLPTNGDPSSFTPGQTLRTDLPVYKIADALPPFPGTKTGATRDWRFERGQGGEWLVNSFNGKGAQAFDPGPKPPAPENPRVDATCKVGTTEIWRLINGSGGWAHPVHIHRNQFQILDRVDSGSGKSLGLLPTQQGLKDVFRLEQNVTILLITKYTSGPTSDKQLGKYVMHCHNVEHEDMAMMIVWEVTP
ncbi:MAG TPA: multicopper oxidase family protein [Terriglobales bacterium]|nr:multicopper oxidase family protein [Terriglobales bacterium]